MTRRKNKRLKKTKKRHIHANLIMFHENSVDSPSPAYGCIKLLYLFTRDSVGRHDVITVVQTISSMSRRIPRNDRLMLFLRIGFRYSDLMLTQSFIGRWSLDHHVLTFRLAAFLEFVSMQIPPRCDAMQ